MKIAHLITGLEVGGAERMLTRLVTATVDPPLNNIVISLMGEGRLGAQIREAGIPLYALNMNQGIPNPFSLFELISILRKEKPDILQTWLYHADFLGLLASRISGIRRLVWNIRCSDMEMEHYSLVSRLVLSFLAKFSRTPDGILVNSEAGRSLHQNLGYKPRIWHFVPNGFDMGEFCPDSLKRESIRSSMGLPKDAFLIGQVARYDPQKDHKTMLKAAEKVLQNNEKAYFLLIGKGVSPETPVFANWLDKCTKRDRVYLFGERDDVPNLLKAMDLFVSSSAYGEGFPNVLGEAMASGVPCVATDVGDSKLVLASTGTLVPKRNSTLLADAILEAASHSFEEREINKKAARDHIEANYALPIILKRYRDIYVSLIPTSTT